MKCFRILWLRMSCHTVRAALSSAGVCTVLFIASSRGSASEKGSSKSDNATALEAVLQGVRDSEALFRDLLFDYTYEVHNLLTGEKLAADKAKLKGRFLNTEKRETRLIRQGRKFYFKEVVHSDGGSGPYDLTKTLIFNGKRMRIVQTSRIKSEDGGYANLITGEEPNVPYAMDPQRMVAWGGAPLSEMLTNPVDEVHLEGEEIVDGVACVRIKTIYTGTDGMGRDQMLRTVYWLAPNRNYLPVKEECYDSLQSRHHPFARMESSDWRGIAPGIFIPFKAVKKNYWEEDLKRGQETLHMTTTITLEQVSLRPNFEDSLFEDLPIPDGIPVYVRENGKIVKSYVQGAEPEGFVTGRKWLLWTFGIGAIVFLTVAVWLSLRKRSRSKAV